MGIEPYEQKIRRIRIKMEKCFIKMIEARTVCLRVQKVATYRVYPGFGVFRYRFGIVDSRIQILDP